MVWFLVTHGPKPRCLYAAKEEWNILNGLKLSNLPRILRHLYLKLPKSLNSHCIHSCSFSFSGPTELKSSSNNLSVGLAARCTITITHCSGKMNYANSRERISSLFSLMDCRRRVKMIIIIRRKIDIDYNYVIISIAVICDLILSLR